MLVTKLQEKTKMQTHIYVQIVQYTRLCNVFLFKKIRWYKKDFFKIWLKVNIYIYIYLHMLYLILQISSQSETKPCLKDAVYDTGINHGKNRF
jgi:hypothetical protein